MQEFFQRAAAGWAAPQDLPPRLFRHPLQPATDWIPLGPQPGWCIMVRYMGHGLKLPQLACERHPAPPVPPFWWDRGPGLPSRLGHILNVPVGSIRPVGLFFKVHRDAFPKGFFMPFTPFPESLPYICPPHCLISHRIPSVCTNPHSPDRLGCGGSVTYRKILIRPAWYPNPDHWGQSEVLLADCPLSTQGFYPPEAPPQRPLSWP